MIVVSAVLVLSRGQTDALTDADERFTCVTVVGVSNYTTSHKSCVVRCLVGELVVIAPVAPLSCRTGIKSFIWSHNIPSKTSSDFWQCLRCPKRQITRDPAQSLIVSGTLLGYTCRPRQSVGAAVQIIRPLAVRSGQRQSRTTRLRR